MKLHYLISFTTLLFLLPVLLFGSGQKDKSLIVPKEAVAVLHIDVEKNLNTQAAANLLDLFFSFVFPGQSRKSPTVILDESLKKSFGINSGGIHKITVFTLLLDMSDDAAPAGIHIECKQGAADEAETYIKDVYSPETIRYRQAGYFHFRIKNQETNMYKSGENLFFASDSQVMEKMLDVLYGNNSVQDNKQLYKLLQKYRDQSFYATGYIPGKSHPPLPSPFDPVQEFGLIITLDKDLSFTANVHVENAEIAERLITSVKGAVALMSMAIVARDKKAYPVLEALIRGIEYKQKDKDAVISGYFSAQDLKKIIELAPVLFMMVGKQ